LCTNYGAQYLVLTVGDKREKHLVFEKICNGIAENEDDSYTADFGITFVKKKKKPRK